MFLCLVSYNMVQGNVTAANSVDYVSGVVIYSVAAALGILIFLCLLYGSFEKSIHQCYRDCGCTCLLPTKVNPDGSIQVYGVRQPTSSERIIALSILAQSPKGTTIQEIEAELVKGPPQNGGPFMLQEAIPEWKKKQVGAYDLETGKIVTMPVD